MAAPKGNSYSAGRPPGALNHTTTQIKQVFADLLEGREDQLADSLERLREKDPKSFLELFIKISERFVPALSRQELTGADGEAFQPIQIILPSPKKDD